MPRSHPFVPRDDVAMFQGDEHDVSHDVPVFRQNVIEADPAFIQSSSPSPLMSTSSFATWLVPSAGISAMGLKLPEMPQLAVLVARWRYVPSVGMLLSMNGRETT